MSALRRYARSFTGFERDARIFLVTTLIYGVALSLWWVDFNLYLTALGFDPAFIGISGTVGAVAGVLVAFPASIPPIGWDAGSSWSSALPARRSRSPVSSW